MSDFEKGFYWLKFDNNEITIGEYTGAWYIIGTEIEFISLPKGIHVIGKVSECTERQPKEALDINGVVSSLPSKEEMEIKLDYLIENKPDAFNKYDEITFRFGFRTCFYWLDKKLRK